jgi:hypothetical protein
MYRFLLFPNFKKKAVTFSYDDGHINDVKLVEILNKYGLKGTFNVNSSCILNPEKNRLSLKQAKELYKSGGHEVAVHGARHLSLSDMDMATATNEILSDRIALEKGFGKIIKGMAYANGDITNEYLTSVKACGIKYARIVPSRRNFDLPTDWLKLSPTCHHNDPELFNLTEKFLNEPDREYYWSRRQRLFYIWGHASELDYNDGWERIENFCSLVGNNPEIWACTNMELYDYIKAYQSLEFDVENKFCFNPTSTTIYMEYFDKLLEIKPGKTVKLK